MNETLFRIVLLFDDEYSSVCVKYCAIRTFLIFYRFYICLNTKIHQLKKKKKTFVCTYRNVDV